MFSDYIYEKHFVFSGSGKERAESLVDFYKDGEIRVIFDISGGDIANEILPYLDFGLSTGEAFSICQTMADMLYYHHNIPKMGSGKGICRQILEVENTIK